MANHLMKAGREGRAAIRSLCGGEVSRVLPPHHIDTCVELVRISGCWQDTVLSPPQLACMRTSAPRALPKLLKVCPTYLKKRRSLTLLKEIAEEAHWGHERLVNMNLNHR